MERESLHFLHPRHFQDSETTLIQRGPFEVSTFRFESGVCGLRLRSDVANLVMLPYQGQQIWSAAIGGRDLTMKSVIPVPVAGVPFLQTFGGFLQHCGVLAMGGPGPNDSHPLHGELPNAEFQKAWAVVGEGPKGSYIGLGGRRFHSAVFGANYMVEPLVKLYAGSTRFEVEFQVTNLGNSPMDLMYMAHINFRPVNDGVLKYSANPTPAHVRVRTGIPTHIQPKQGYREILDELQVR